MFITIDKHSFLRPPLPAPSEQGEKRGKHGYKWIGGVKRSELLVSKFMLPQGVSI